MTSIRKISTKKCHTYSMKFSIENKSTVEDEKQAGESIGELNIIKKAEEENSSNDSNSEGEYDNSIVDEEENERNQKMEEEFNKTKKRGVNKKIKFV